MISNRSQYPGDMVFPDGVPGIGRTSAAGAPSSRFVPRLKLLEENGDPIVSLEEAKAYLRVDNTAEDVLIASLVAAAARSIERYLSRSLKLQTFDLWSDKPPLEGAFDLPRMPLVSVESVKLYVTDNTETTVSASSYTVDEAAETPRVFFSDSYVWPENLRRFNAFRCTFTAGHDPDDNPVPEPIKLALLRQVARWFENREETGAGESELSEGTKAMLQSYRTAALK